MASGSGGVDGGDDVVDGGVAVVVVDVGADDAGADSAMAAAITDPPAWAYELKPEQRLKLELETSMQPRLEPGPVPGPERSSAEASFEADHETGRAPGLRSTAQSGPGLELEEYRSRRERSSWLWVGGTAQLGQIPIMWRGRGTRKKKARDAAERERKMSRGQRVRCR